MDSSNIEDQSDINIERGNVVQITKLIVKDILRFAVRSNRLLDEDNPLIIQLLRALERIILHCLKPKKILNSVTITGLASADPWIVINDLLRSSSADIIETVHQMGIRSGFGRFKAWLKLALMQKQLGEYFRILTEQRTKLATYYFPAAILLQESGTEISGLLLGLSVVECNFIKLKETRSDIDSYNGPLNYNAYLTKDFDDSINSHNFDLQDSPETIKNLLDQKNYTEELNSILQSKVNKLQENITSLERSSTLTKSNLAELTNKNLYLEEQINSMKTENDLIQNRYEFKSKMMQDDLEVERSTYHTSRTELHQLSLELEKKLKEETQMRLDADKALQVEVQKKADIELGMSNLERQVTEKQETILNVRKQMEKIKETNIGMNNDLKEKQNILDHKIMLVEKLEEKTLGMASIINQMDTRIKKMTTEKVNDEKALLELKEQIEYLTETCLQKDGVLNNLNDKIDNYEYELKELKSNIKKSKEKEQGYLTQIEYLEKEMLMSKKRCQEQAEALEEMAGIVETSKLEADNLMEMQASLKEAKWTDDKDIVECNQCSRVFNVSRRKHHCRRCGGVYCHDCSSSRMSLASSSKPMRVCDTCHSALLKMYTSLSSSNNESND